MSRLVGPQGMRSSDAQVPIKSLRKHFYSMFILINLNVPSRSDTKEKPLPIFKGKLMNCNLHIICSKLRALTVSGCGINGRELAYPAVRLVTRRLPVRCDSQERFPNQY